VATTPGQFDGPAKTQPVTDSLQAPDAARTHDDHTSGQEGIGLRLLIVTGLIALLCAPVALAQFDRELAAGGKPLSLEDGRGVAVVKSREGSILGSVDRGRIRATNASVYGCESRKRVNRSTVLCIGRDLDFSATGYRWQIVASGAGINASGKLKGTVTLQGTSGTYSLEAGGTDPRPWPRSPRTFRLG
jgi:hypothetical protein